VAQGERKFYRASSGRAVEDLISSQEVSGFYHERSVRLVSVWGKMGMDFLPLGNGKYKEQRSLRFRTEEKMRKTKYLLGGLLLLTGLACSAVPGSGAEGVIYKLADPSGSFCQLKFTAIRKGTLYWDRPVLTQASEGDIIDFYGPCDHDPLGKEEVLRQRRDFQFERHLGFDDE
jgi:hypothetical protein